MKSLIVEISLISLITQSLPNHLLFNLRNQRNRCNQRFIFVLVFLHPLIILIDFISDP